MADPRYPATWEEAMSRASERLRAVETGFGASDKRHGMLTAAAEAHASIADAWIAYARELTAHGHRAPGGG